MHFPVISINTIYIYIHIYVYIVCVALQHTQKKKKNNCPEDKCAEWIWTHRLSCFSTSICGRLWNGCILQSWSLSRIRYIDVFVDGRILRNDCARDYAVAKSDDLFRFFAHIDALSWLHQPAKKNGIKLIWPLWVDITSWSHGQSHMNLFRHTISNNRLVSGIKSIDLRMGYGKTVLAIALHDVRQDPGSGLSFSSMIH